MNLSLLAVMIAVSFLAWPKAGMPPLPFFTLPIAVLLFNLPAGLLPYFKIGRFSLNGSERGHFVIWTGLTFLLAVVHAGCALKVMGVPIDVAGASGVLMGLFLVVMGNFATKLREDYAYGVLTRWTRDSDRAWKRAHRLFGWMLVGLGVVVALTSLVYKGPLFVPLFMLGVLACCTVPAIASYFYWKQDPDRREPGQPRASADA